MLAARMSPQPRLKEPQPGLFQVRWSLAFVAFLVYVYTIHSFKLPIGTATMVAALIGLILERRRLRFPPLLVWLGIFIIWSFVGYTVTAYPERVWLTINDSIKIWLVLLVATNVLSRDAEIRLYMVFTLACFALYPVRGTLFNFLAGEFDSGRIAWNFVFANANDLGALCIPQLSMAVGLLWTEGRSWIRWSALAGTIVLPLVILISASRGAFIALGVFTIGLWLGQRRRGRALVLISILGLIAAVAAPDWAWRRLSGVTKLTSTEQLDEADQEGSARQRYEIWRVALAIAKDHPIAGVGRGTYRDVHYRYVSTGRFHPSTFGRRDAHSTYFRVLAECGIPGLLLILGMLITTFIDAERTRRRCRERLHRRAQQLLAIELGLVGLCVAAIWGSFDQLVYVYLHLALIGAVADAARRELADSEAPIISPVPVVGRSRARRGLVAGVAPFAPELSRGQALGARIGASPHHRRGGLA